MTRRGVVFFVGFMGFTGLLLGPQTATAAQVCGCKKISNGKVKRLVSPGPPTCSLSFTPICWNEDQPPGDFSVRVGISAGTVLIPNDAATVLSWDTEIFDNGGLHVGTSSQLVAPVAGKYHVFAGIYWQNVAGGIRTVVLRVNGSKIVTGQTIPGVSNPSGVYSAASTVIDLAVNDYVECLVYHDLGASLDVNGLPSIVAGAYGDVSSEFGMAKLQ